MVVAEASVAWAVPELVVADQAAAFEVVAEVAVDRADHHAALMATAGA